MELNNKFRWLPEVVEDMIDFCEKNDLQDTRLSLLHVHAVMLNEITIDQHDTGFDRFGDDSPNNST